MLASGAVIGVDALPDGVIDFALAERATAYPAAQKPQEMIMIEQALIRFRGDKSKAARLHAEIRATGGGTYQGDGSTCGTVTCPVVLTPYVDPLPLPAVAALPDATPLVR